MGYNVEGMPSIRPVTELDADPIVHTNHVLDPEAIRVEALRPEELVASSHERLDAARRILAEGTIGADELMALTREPDAICQRAVPPMDIESSGAAIMRPRTGEFWACWGRPIDNEYTHFSLARAGRG